MKRYLRDTPITVCILYARRCEASRARILQLHSILGTNICKYGMQLQSTTSHKTFLLEIWRIPKNTT